MKRMTKSALKIRRREEEEELVPKIASERQEGPTKPSNQINLTLLRICLEKGAESQNGLPAPPQNVRVRGSILGRLEDRQNTGRHRRVGRILASSIERQVVVVDLEVKGDALNLKLTKIMVS